MEFNRLRSFAAVAEAGHLTRAAGKLHISQPALSAQIKALEDELGLALFERTATGMVLTGAGKRLLAEAEKILAATQALQAEARALKGEVSGKARLGTLSDPEFIRLGVFMSEAVKRYPMLEIEFQHEITGVAMEHVRKGALDASFYYGEISETQIAAVALREISYRVAAPAAWRDRVENAGWEDIAELPWIMPPPVSTHNRLASALSRAHGVELKKLVGADHEAVVSSLVVSGLGLALIRDDVARQKVREGEIVLWRDTRIDTTLWFIYLRAREHDPVIRALLDVLRDVWELRRESGSAARRRAGRGAAVTATPDSVPPGES
jgi:DNA-binding transcriptional LysR family regulator